MGQPCGLDIFDEQRPTSNCQRDSDFWPPTSPAPSFLKSRTG